LSGNVDTLNRINKRYKLILNNPELKNSLMVGTVIERPKERILIRKKYK